MGIGEAESHVAAAVTETAVFAVRAAGDAVPLRCPLGQRGVFLSLS